MGSEAFHIEIRGTINPATSRYMSRAIENAEADKANFLLVELDTAPGVMSEPTRDRSKKLFDKGVWGLSGLMGGSILVALILIYYSVVFVDACFSSLYFQPSRNV